MSKQTEALKLAQKALEELLAEKSYWWQEVERDIVKALEKAESICKQALAEQPAQQEPVACVHIKDGCLVGSHRDGSKLFPDGQYGLWSIDNSPAQRKPLTDEQRNWVVATCPTPRHIIDTVEKMHGIKGDE